MRLYSPLGDPRFVNAILQKEQTMGQLLECQQIGQPIKVNFLNV